MSVIIKIDLFSRQDHVLPKISMYIKGIYILRPSE